MKLDRLMIAAPKSGSGKTTITCALLQALKDAGQKVVSYKCGPDYIDPMFHQKVIGISSKNLDTFFTDEEETKRLFLKNRTEEEFAVLEGVMGLFDGLGGVREEGSSYHLAEVVKAPILLVVDAKGMGRSIIPLIAGFLAYDRSKLIKGVLFNRMSGAYYEIIKPLVERECNICVVGYFPEDKRFFIESRYLGLTMPDELINRKKQLQSAEKEFRKTVSIEKIMQIAANAEVLECKNLQRYNKKVNCSKEEFPVIAVARDQAFCFYYEDNLLLLQEYGAKIVYFSPLFDKKLPEQCCGILIGGGYPELYSDILSQNTDMLAAIRNGIENGIPVVAECGGFIYLHSIVEDKEKKRYTMVGAIPSVCYDMGKLVRFGYIEIKEKKSNFLPEGTRIRGHEFHYFDSEENGSDCLAVKPVTGRTYSCIIVKENVWMGFPHLYYPSNPSFAESFVKKAKVYQKNKNFKFL